MNFLERIVKILKIEHSATNISIINSEKDLVPIALIVPKPLIVSSIIK